VGTGRKLASMPDRRGRRQRAGPRVDGHHGTRYNDPHAASAGTR
jgi:hypothetical protein